MNRGSATLKSALYEFGRENNLLLSISVRQAGASGGRLKITDAGEKILLDTSVASEESNVAVEKMAAWLDEHHYLAGLTAAGHRLVHGGARLPGAAAVTPEFLAGIWKSWCRLIRIICPQAIRGIQFVARKFPQLPQVACFDTAFHSTLPTVARMYALPRRFYDEGVRRYGFHGLSYRVHVGELRKIDAKLAAGRVIIAHLGSGASMVALKTEKAWTRPMGFTPLEGLVMSTRVGRR